MNGEGGMSNPEFFESIRVILADARGKAVTRLNRVMVEAYWQIGRRIVEELKHGLSGYWSRRINDEHRIVYKVVDDHVFIAQLRYHYKY